MIEGFSHNISRILSTQHQCVITQLGKSLGLGRVVTPARFASLMPEIQGFKPGTFGRGAMSNSIRGGYHNDRRKLRRAFPGSVCYSSKTPYQRHAVNRCTPCDADHLHGRVACKTGAISCESSITT